MKTVLTIEDIYKIGQILTENGYTELPLTIINEVYTKERLKHINDEIYKINSENAYDPSEFENVDIDQIDVKLGIFTFRYKLIEEPNV